MNYYHNLLSFTFAVVWNNFKKLSGKFFGNKKKIYENQKKLQKFLKNFKENFDTLYKEIYGKFQDILQNILRNVM